MKDRPKASQFQLEALEPRIMLSADVLAAEAAAGLASDGSVPCIEETWEEPLSRESEQSVGAEAADPFAEMEGVDTSDEAAATAPGEAEASAEDTSAQADATGTESSSPTSPTRDTEVPAGSGSTEPDIVNITPAQLIETLRAANGPPGDDGINLHLTPDQVLDFDGDTLQLDSDDVLSGSGSILGGIAGGGYIRPGNSPGHITVSSFSPGPDTVTEIEIQGLTQGTGYDWIEVTGAAALDGTLRIIFNPQGGYTPALGDSFNVITYGSVTGEFANWLGTASIPGHPSWALKPTFTGDSGTPGALTLTIVQTPVIAGPAGSALDGGLDTLGSVANFLDDIGNFAATLPFIGSDLGALSGLGTAIQNAVANRLSSFPNPAQVTSSIENWDGTSFGGFAVDVRGVLAHYGTLSGDPMWWDVTLELSPAAVNQVLSDVAGGVFDAAFSGTPSVSVNGKVVLDFAFGYDSGFFTEIDSIEARADVDASGIAGFGFDFDTPTGTQGLSGSGGTVTLSASVAATPDAGILTDGRITQSTLSGLNASNIGDAFNLDEAGTLNATFPLTGTLSFLGFSLTGDYAVRVQSDDLLNQTPDVWVEVNSTLVFMGQTMNGSFALKNTGTETIIEASGVNFDLNAGASRILGVNNGSGTFVMLGSDLAGTMTMDFATGPAIANLSISATGLTLKFNTSNGAVPTIDDVAVNLPAGPYYRVSGNGTISLTSPQASLTGDFVFEPRDADANTGNGYEEVAVGVANLSFEFDDGATDLLTVTNGTGAFVFRSNGIVGTVSANVAFNVPQLSLEGVFTVTLNDTASAYNEDVDVNGTTVEVNVPGGPYLKVTASGATPADHAELTVLGIVLTGDFVFERKQTSTGGETVVTVGVSNMSLDLSSLASDLISVTDGSGAFLLTADGLAGEASATVGINVSGLSLGGAFNVRINNTSAAVNETVTVNGAPVVINTPAGPYLQINGTGVTLAFLGVTFTGDFSFEQRTSEGGSQLVTVVADNVSFDFGTSILTATGGHGFFVINDAGIAGQGEITVAVSAFGGGFSHTFQWAFNTTVSDVNQTVDWEGTPMGVDLPGGPYNQIDTGSAIPISVSFGGYTQSITGRFILTLVDGSPDYVTVGASSVSATLMAGSVGLQVSGGAGACVIYDSGLAGEITVDSATFSGAGAIGISAMNLKLRFNNTGANVGDPDPIVVSISDNAADDVSLQFIGSYYANFLSVSGTAEITGLAGAVALGGNFVFERAQIDTNNDSTLEDVFKVGVTDLHFELKAGSLSIVSFHNGTGAFLINGSGLAGEADLEFQVGIVGLSGTIGLEANSTGAAVVNASVTTPGGTTNLNLAAGNYLRVNVDGFIHVGSIAVPFTFVVEINGSNVEFRRTSDNELLVSIDSAGNISLGTPLTSLTNFDFAQASPFDWVMMLRELGNWIENFRKSSLFDVEVPFTGGTTIGDAFDWSQLFLDTIYKYMVTVELQSAVMQATTVNTGALSGETLTVKIGDNTHVLTVTDTIGSATSRDGNELVTLLQNAISAAGLTSLLVARINRNDQVVIALTEDEIAKGSTLDIVAGTTKMQQLGFGTGDSDTTNSDQVAVLTERYDTQDFIEVLADILNDGVVDHDGGVNYQAAQQVYTYTVDKMLSYDTMDLFGEPNIPFNFDLDLGPIADAVLTGALEFNVTVGFQFTLGFDLGAAEVPRILSSSLVPVPANGRISENARFGVYLNDALPNPGDPFSALFPLELQASATSTNNSIDDLATDLNNLFAVTAYGGGTLGDVLIAQKAGDGIAISARDSQLGIINRITIISPKNGTFNTFGSEIGIGMDVQDLDGNDLTTQDQIFVSSVTSPIKGLFIENASLTGSASINTTMDGIDGSLRFGFVEVSTEDGAFGTLAYDGVTPAPLTASVTLEDQDTGEMRFYFRDLMNGTSSNNIANMVPDFDFTGSFLARLDNIKAGGLGFSMPLGSNPEVSLWIPDVTTLDYNPDPYDPATNNEGIFVTYPDLSSLENFTSLSFTQIINALNLIADNLSQLSAFSFLDEKLPVIDISVNDMIDYASKFAELIDGAAASGSQSSLQDTIAEVEHQIEVLFDLDPNILTISLDDGGLSGLTGTTSGGQNGSTASTLTLNASGNNNAVTISTKAGNLGIAGDLNDAIVRFVADPTVTGTGATAEWDATDKVLTVRINSGHTTANAIISAITGLAGAPWTASLSSTDPGNTGAGSVVTSALVTTGGVNSSTASTATIMPGGDNNNFMISSSSLGTAGDLNGSVIRLVGDSAVSGNTAQVSWDSTSKLLTIKINPGVTTSQVIVNAINGATTPWNAALAPPDNGTDTNTGAGTITTTALKFSFLFSTAYADSLPFQLDLQSLVGQLAGDNAAVRAFLDFATTLVQIKGSGQLTVSASADLRLDFGLDLTNPSTVRPFFYDTTGVTLLAKVLGTNIDVEASLGSVFGIFIKGGTVTLDRDGDPSTDAGSDDPSTPEDETDRGAEFRLGLKDNDGNGRHYFDENWFNSDSIDLHLDGGVSATLPVFAPFESTPLSGDSDENGDGYPDNYLVLEIPDLVRLFLDEAVSTQAVGLSKVVKFAGLNNDLKIVSTNPAHNNFNIIFLDTLSGNVANASFNASTNTLTVNIDAGVTTALVARNAIQSASGAGGALATSALTSDDDGDPNTTTNSGAGTLEKLSLITPDFSSLFDDLDFCDVIANSIDEILDGLDLLLGSIQDGLNEIVYNTDLPLIGKGLMGAANFIDDFRTGLLQSLRDEVEAAGGNGLTAVENAIKKALWNTLGPGGLDLLVDYDTGNALNESEGYSQLDVVLDCDTGLVVNVRLSKSLALLDTSQNPIDFDIGVPGFGLEVDGNVVVSIGFDLKFGFGVNAEDGFYFNSSLPSNDPELVIEFKAEIPGLHAAGQLLFLQLDVQDDADDPSIFRGFFEVDLMDPNHDGKLTFAEMTSSGTQFSDIIAANLGAEAHINLDLAASFGGNTAFPRVLAQFHLDWMFDIHNGAGTPQITFDNIYLDLGTFISDFLAPVLSKIQEVTKPIQPIIDVITARIPVISDLAGQTITLLDLAEIFGLLEPSTVDFIHGVLTVIELINDLDGLGEGSILIPFGAFSLTSNSDGQMKNIQALQDMAEMTLDEIADAAANATGPGTSSSYSSATAGFMGKADSLDNFSIPIFKNPGELFNLFIGEPVRLIEWRMPTFKFEFTYTQSIPIYPPLYAQFGGTIGAEIKIGFGYDTFGIQKYISSEDKNFLDILDGFYVLDFDANGNEQPELRLYGELFAGASIDLVVVEAGVRGGLGFEVTFDLNDVNDDGKVRVSEIIANAQQDPRCIFDIEGRIYLFLEAFLNIDLFFFSIDKTWRFAEITLFSFEITCPEPTLAANMDGSEFSGGDLYLNFGSRANYRKEIDTTDNSETVIVKTVGGSAGNESVEVQWGSWKQTFDGVSKVILPDAGNGDDYIDTRGVLSEVEIHGGTGNDQIFLSDGTGSTAFGDDGNDTITASAAATATNVTIHGGNGNDVLTGGPVAITIYGDGGNDTITGSPDADSLYGDDGTGTSTDGADVIEGLAGDDTIRGGLGNDTIEGGSGDDWIRGDGGNDTIRGSRGDDVLDGGLGDDRLYGSSGNDLLLGGPGSDWANGHGGVDLLIGEAEPDLLIAGMAVNSGNLASIRAAIANIPVNGITVEHLSGGTSTYDDGNGNMVDNLGNDILIGGGNTDVLFGGPGNDFLYGGNFLNGGETDVIEEDGNDFFDGGPGNDTIFGDDAMGRTGERDTGISINTSIFYDLNFNGIRDANETGFGGVTVELYRNDGVLIGDTETESDGSFRFTGLDPDRYYMIFSLPTGLSYTTPFQGDADIEAADNDSDVYDGVAVPAPSGKVNGQTPDFQLTFDETEKSVTAGYTGNPRVSVSNVYVNEGNTGLTMATVTVTLSGPQIIPVSIDYRTEDGNDAGHPERNAVEATGDYVSTSGTLTFGPGETSKTITVGIRGDTIYEEHQQLRLILSNASAGIDLPTSPETTVLVTILNDDPIPEISISDYIPPSQLDSEGHRYYTVGEGDDAKFTISLSNPSMYDITVWYLVDSSYDCGCDPNPAKPYPLYPDGDYVQPAPTMITIKAGTLYKQITVQLRDDAGNPIDEPDESFYVDLYNPSYAKISDGHGIGIVPDDDPEVSASIHKFLDPSTFFDSVFEGDGGYKLVPVEVTLNKVSGKTVTLTYATSPGSAVESVFSQAISNGTDYQDYEGLPRPNDSVPDEQEVLVFQPGETSKTLLVKVYGDTFVEDDEFFFVNLIDATNAQIAANPATESNHVTIMIENDDSLSVPDAGPWSVYFGDTMYTVQEPDSGTTFALVDIHRTIGSSEPIAVFYTTNGTATAGADYGSVFRQVVYFEGNQLTKYVLIPIYSDNLSEGDETVTLSLRNPTGGPVRASPDTATLVIKDEDVPTVSIDPLTVTEGDPPGSTVVTFTVKLDKPAPPGGVTVDWQTISLTARSEGGSDFIAASGTVTFNAGNTTAVVATRPQVTITRDDVPELTERFAVRLTNAVRANISEDEGAATATIYDDDDQELRGTVFYDNNGNGFLDLGENGIENVDVTLTWMDGGVQQTATIQTDSSGEYAQMMPLGQVTISVDGSTVKSPYQKGPLSPLFAFLWSGSYETTTDNEVQTVDFDGITGISPFEVVGYKNSFSFSLPEGADDVGRGGTDDTIFGGPGDDVIDAGAGDDHVIGGHWMTATDGNMPVNNESYDAQVIVVTDETNLVTTYGLAPGTTLHSIYDQGPIFSVVPPSFAGEISGQIWVDGLPNNVQGTGDYLFTQGVLVYLLDCSGNPVNAMYSTDGTYAFTNLYVDEDNPSAESEYVVEFELPEDYTFVDPNVGDGTPNNDGSITDNDAEFVNRTRTIAISANAPKKTAIDAGIIQTSLIPSATGFQFSRATYSVYEVTPGYVDLVVQRGSSFVEEVVVVRTFDGTGANGAVSTPDATKNFTARTQALVFDVGETEKVVRITIHNREMAFCDFRYFTVELRDATGRPYDTAAVYIIGQGSKPIKDDDTISGGSDWDIILGDSGNIPGYAVVAEYGDIGQREKLGDIVTFGGQGHDTIHADIGADYIDGQLGNDNLYGDDGVDIVIGGLGDDNITVGQGDDDIRGDHGRDTVISTRSVPGILLTPFIDPMHPGTLVHQQIVGGVYDVLNEHRMHDTFEVARLFGDSQPNQFDLNAWDSTAFVSGGGGSDTLLVTNNNDMKLRDATLLEKLLFNLFYGFAKDASLSLPLGATYHLASLENVVLTDGPAGNEIDASGYSRPVTFIATAGDDAYLGGSANDTFVFDGDLALGTNTVTGNGGQDLLDFTRTSSARTVNVDLDVHSSQPAVAGRVNLILTDDIENLSGGDGNDFLYGNGLNNVLLGGPGNDWLEGRGGDETYVFDTDNPWGQETVVENIADTGHDIIDFSGTTTLAVSLNLSVLGSYQTVNANLALRIMGEGVEEVIGGSLNDTLRGNSNNNTLRGGPGSDLLDGKSGDDVLDGGPGNDDLDGGEGGEVVGDTINESANTNFTLTDTSLTRSNGEVDTLDNIEVVNLTGGSSSNVFTLTGWSGKGSVNGSGGFDTLIWAADTNFTLTDSGANGVHLVLDSGQDFDLSGIELARLTGGQSNNTLDASALSLNATMLPRIILALTGGEGDDTLIGSHGPDTLLGGAGNDTLTGGPGNNLIDGGSGNDHLAETRDAYLFVITNNNLLTDLTVAAGDEEYDFLTSIETAAITGGAGTNIFDVTGWTAGTITVNGAGGDDQVRVQMPVPSLPEPMGGTLTLTNTSVTFTGGAGTITLSSIESAIITGTDRNDTIDASAFTGSAYLQGLAGDDTLVSASDGAIQIVDGGEGDDLFVFSENGLLESTYLIGGDGVDTLDFSAFTSGITVNLSTIGAFQTVLTGELSLRLVYEDVENMIGGSGNDTLTGNSLDNTFTGGAGGDIINGQGGTNTLIESDDTNFTLTDISLTDGGGTVDTLSNIQVAELTGGNSANTLDASGFTGSATLRGGAGNDILIGGFGNDWLVGGTDDDTLRGNAGNDTYLFDVDEVLGDDTVDETMGTTNGFDRLDFSSTTTVGITVNLSDTSQQTVHATNLRLTILDGTSLEYVTGGDGNDSLTGNSADNIFIGGLGDDQFDGNGGTLDTVFETRDADFTTTDSSLTIQGVDEMNVPYTETDSLAGIQRIVLIGGESNNVMDATAFTGVAWLSGMGGNDALYGGSGNDLLLGGDGEDTLRGNGGDDDLRGGNDNDTYIFDLSFDQGNDTLREEVGGGYADTLLGIGLSGLQVDLNASVAYDDMNLKLTLVFPSQVEYSF